MIKRLFLCLFALVCALSLVSCATNFEKPKRAIDETHSSIHAAKEVSNSATPPVVDNPGYYVNDNPIAISRVPAWAKRHITLDARGMPFNLMVNRILQNTPAAVSYQTDMKKTPPVSMQYSGTIHGALTKLANIENYAYRFQGRNNVHWEAYVTHTFNISFMPGVSNYLLGQNANASPGSSNASGAGDIVTVRGNLGNEQYSNFQASSLSVWEDLRKSLNELKSPKGKVWVSEATTTVTVRDRPDSMRAIAHYIKRLNQIMSEQVSLHVQVLELDLDEQYAYGIDFNKLMATLKKTMFTFSGGAGSAAIVGSQVAGVGSTALTTLEIGSKNHGSAILNALSEQGKLRVVTEPTVVTMNNQVAEVRITRDTGYLQSVSTTNTAQVGSESSLTPGVVTDGFSLYLLPKIQGKRIYLQISSSISTLVRLVKVSNEPVAQEGKDQPPNQETPFEAIQVPTLQEKHFNQRTVLYTGETLLITGFEQLRDELKKVGLYGTKIPAGLGSVSRNVQTIVLITPTILRNH